MRFPCQWRYKRGRVCVCRKNCIGHRKNYVLCGKNYIRRRKNYIRPFLRCCKWLNYNNIYKITVLG